MNILNFFNKQDKNYYQGCAGNIKHNEINKFDFSDSEYILEEKFDGIWIDIIFDNNGQVTLKSNNMQIKDSKKLKSLISYIQDNIKLKNTHIQGELAFGSQKGTEYQKKYGHSKIDVFDILVYNNSSKHRNSLLYRKKLLNKILPGLNPEWISISRYEKVKNNQQVQNMHNAIIANGGEGLIIKDIHDNKYIFDGKSPFWYKIKKYISMDYVIMDYKEPTSENYKEMVWIGSIICGLYVNGKLTEKVTVKNMSDKFRAMFSFNKQKYIGSVVEIGGNEVFKSGSIRHPSFLRMRDDKLSEKCTWAA